MAGPRAQLDANRGRGSACDETKAPGLDTWENRLKRKTERQRSRGSPRELWESWLNHSSYLLPSATSRKCRESINPDEDRRSWRPAKGGQRSWQGAAGRMSPPGNYTLRARKAPGQKHRASFQSLPPRHSRGWVRPGGAGLAARRGEWEKTQITVLASALGSAFIRFYNLGQGSWFLFASFPFTSKIWVKMKRLLLWHFIG